jgi:hypothetical protein
VNYHPLVIYLAVGPILATYVAYLLYFTVLRSFTFPLYFGLVNHAISSILVIGVVLTGLSAEKLEYVRQKVSFILMAPHKWLGIALALLTVASFIYLWMKQLDSNRKLGILISLLGLVLTITVLVLGWQLRLIFF